MTVKLKKLFVLLICLVFGAYAVWWFYLHFSASPDSPLFAYFSDSYGVIAGLGGIIGLLVSRKWNGLKSYVGRSVGLFSLGLFFQFLGQLSYSAEYYIYGIENSYPSVGEIFFLASIPAYALGVWYLAKASGSKLSLSNMKNKIGAVVLPLLMMGISYYFFVHGTEFSEFPFVEAFLIVVYPLGQAVYVSFAALAYYLTGNLVGGVMRGRVMFILFSLIFQYVADSLFLYRVTYETWYPADISELMFAISYFLMAMGLIKFLTAFETLGKDNEN